MTDLAAAFEKLDQRARGWVGLLALVPEGARIHAMDRVCRLGALESGATLLTQDDLLRDLTAAGIEVPRDPQVGLFLTDPVLRRLGLDWLVSSGAAPRWAERFDSPLADQLSSQYIGYELPHAVTLGLRLAILGGGERARIRRACTRFGGPVVEAAMVRGAQRLLVEPVDDAQLLRLAPTFRIDLCLRELAGRLHRPAVDTPFWQQHVLGAVDAGVQSAVAQRVLFEHALLRQDELELARFGSDPESTAMRVAALLALGSEDPGQALAALQAVYETQPVARGQTRPPLPGLVGLLHVLALAATPTGPHLTLLRKLDRAADGGDLGQAVRAALGYAGASAQSLPWAPELQSEPLLLHSWTLVLLCRWAGVALPSTLVDWAQSSLSALRASGWRWMAEHLAAAAGDSNAQPAGPWWWRQPEQAWQRALRAIEGYARPSNEKGASARHSRIRVNLSPSGRVPNRALVEVRELRPATKGGWTSGRMIETPRAVDEALARLDPEDIQARELLLVYQRSVGTYQHSVELTAPIIDALVGYPYVVTGPNDDRPMTIVRRTPRLRIQRSDDGRARVEIDPPPLLDHKRTADWSATRVYLTDYDADTLRLARALGPDTEFPEAAVPALLALAPQLSRRIEVDADLGAAATVTDLDHRIHVVIEPLREGLRLRLRTRPMGADGVYFVPAAGSVEILGLRDGAAVRGRRALAEEQQALNHLLETVPVLAGAEGGDAIDIPAAEIALETLSHLVDLGEELVLDWSTERRWAMSKTRNFGQLAVKVRAQRDWFHADGGLTLEDGNVVSLATLLEALPSSQGRFVRLADDRIIALSQELARQLRQVRALADENGRLDLAPVAASALQPLIDAGADIDLDDAFEQQLARIAAAEDSVAVLPPDLQAELRDYQIEGFRWLMRLASWGAGACLADDMGLGKTLQALALLLARAPAGPALVVAPTSVVPNWRNEAQRFAPTLELRWYGEGDRAKALDQLGPGCVVLVSYGLLALNIESFEEIRFATLVLDEAQAIKNAAAQRTKAIRRVQADFRIATTGTPIENHLGELWSLMRVLNPGLLGSQEHFSRRFMAPMERNPRGAERETLRRLISPFMLRRLKSQVLAELPPRTEIVLTVEPSPGEARLLAAVRRQALERIDSGGLPEEAKRFHVLAEITRLRRAACHPSLVAPELNLSGAKLEQLLELVSELKENRHRALVFSQFVDYLDLVRAAFDQAGISYQYLDGSTPSKAREAAVSAFQGGQGDVFLLSLKAGGVGLNLTAADYVIHLDPWWNPAVEQQATDRAHRIGQTRPVTVYKLVVKGSIEEQILALHGSKREIADSVLAGQDSSAPMSVTELIGLLGAGGEF